MSGNGRTADRWTHHPMRRVGGAGILSAEGAAMPVTKAYEEVIDFIAAGVSPRDVAEYRPCEEAMARVRDLVAREKSTGLSAKESSELQSYLQLEHIMRLAKARARKHLDSEPQAE